MRKRTAPKPRTSTIGGIDRELVRQARALAKARKFAASWIRDAHDVRAVLAGCRFDAAAGEHVIEFFRDYLRHSKGQFAGQAFLLQPWQDAILRSLFGWKRADGTRRYRKAYIEIPKKNGKSTMLAGIELYLFLADNEPGAEVYCVAVDKDQASIVFNEAAHMVRQSPELFALLGKHIVDSKKQITHVDAAAKFGALSADVPSKEGLNIHGAGIDELHAHKSRAMFDTLVYGGAARRQPMLVMITTAGIYDPASIGWEQHEYARKVIDQQIEDWSFLAVIYGAYDKDDWTDPKVWARVNPSWGVTINPETFAEECREAQSAPTKQNSFRRYRLNQWVQQTTRAIDLAVWDRSAGHVALTREHFRGRVCDLGLDLSSVNDLTAAVYAFPGCDDDEDAVDLWARFWVPQAQLDNPKNPNQILYQQWVEAGLLRAVPGRVIDYDAVLADLMEDAAYFTIRDVNIDHLFQGQHLATKLEQEGLAVFPMRQGFLSFGPAWKEFLRLLLSGKLHHGGHPILRWMADNVVTAMDAAGNEKVIKEQNAKKVDGIVAGVMAVDRTRRHGVADTGDSVYDHGEIFSA